MFGGDFMDRSKKVLKKRKQDLSIPKFQELFNTEQACHDYLFKLKWPNGFVCSKCEHNEYYFVKKNSLYQCKCCKKQHSVTAGTLFHGSHVSLRQWFWAIYLISRDKRGYSAVALKNALNVSYPTAWLMLQKIRTAMANKDEDYILSGIIVIGDAFFGGKTEGKKRGRGTEQSNVLVNVSVTEKNQPLFVKMQVVENMKKEQVLPAVQGMVESGAILRSDAHRTLANLEGYQHQVIIASKDKDKAKQVLHWVNVVISNAKSAILGTYHGLPDKHIQKYLDEYCYRFNRRFCEHQIFSKLVKACVMAKPIALAEITL